MLMFNADELFERLGLTVNCEDCKHHNKDYISKCDNSTWMEVCDILDYMTPIDAAPVVRCKDCKHLDEHSQYGYDDENGVYGNYCMLWTPEDDFYAVETPEDGFCYNGERRDDETDRR